MLPKHTGQNLSSGVIPVAPHRAHPGGAGRPGSDSGAGSATPDLMNARAVSGDRSAISPGAKAHADEAID